MGEFPEPLMALMDNLRRLPGVGAKTAQRLALHILKAPQEHADALARALQEVKRRMRLCSSCFNITEVDPCAYCTATDRDDTRICVIEEPNNLVVIERTGQYRGRYHVLGGTLSPLQGRGPDSLHVEPLLERLRAGGVEEVILANNPNVEGEATALYLGKLMQPLGLTVTRIAQGLPVGTSLDHVDEVTLVEAICFDFVPDGYRCRCIESLFPKEALGGHAGGFEVAAGRLRNDLFAHVLETELDGVIAIPVLGADIGNNTGANLDD